MEIVKTQRGFSLINFKDANGDQCSLQESSNIDPHIWLGIDNVRPIDGHYLGRMHLSVELAKQLIPHLIAFTETGYLPDLNPQNGKE